MALIPNKPHALKYYLYAGFFFIGIITVILGQILPALSSRISLNDNQSGYLFISQFTGSLLGVFLYSASIRKFGYLRTLFASFVLMAIGCLGLNTDIFSFCISSIFVYGIGIGSSIPTINMLIVELSPARSASALNMVNVFWGIGAIICKPYVDLFGSRTDTVFPTVLLSILLFAVGILILNSKFKETSSEASGGFLTLSGEIWRNPIAWLIAVFNFIVIGIESSIGGWITSFESRLQTENSLIWLSAASVFFLTMVLGRTAGSFLVKKVSVNSLLLINSFVMLAGISLIICATDLKFLLFGTAVLGFGTSSVFPTNMARFTNIFGADSTKNAAPIFILGSLGGASLTWLVGFISSYSGDLRNGFYAVAAACIILPFLQFVISRKSSNAANI